jgi:hypothetical protein
MTLFAGLASLLLAGCALQGPPAITAPTAAITVATSAPSNASATPPLARPSAQPSTTSAVVDETADYRALGYPDQRKIVRDSKGNLYVAYRKKDRSRESGCYHIFVSRSTDGGASWSVVNGNAPIEQADDCTQRVPAIAVDARDALHVVWYGKDSEHTGENDRQIKYTHSTDGGVSWSDWVNIAEVKGYADQTLWQEHPTIYLSGSAIYVAWQGPDANSPTAPQIKLTRSLDGGQTWEHWRNISPRNRSNHSRPTIVGNRAGDQLYILAYGEVDSTQQIIWTSSTDSGNTWSAWSAVTPIAADQRHVSAVIDSHDQLHAIWRQIDQNGIARIEYASYAGHAWSDPVPLAPNSSAYQFFPSLAVTSDDTLWATWTESDSAAGAPEDDPEKGQIAYASKPPGAAWGARTSVPAASGIGIYASLRWGQYNNGGNVDLIWLERVDTNHWRIRHTTLGTW